ncbi:MAG: hypothetical protein ACRD2F_01875 [Terriglobales bacterium]
MPAFEDNGLEQSLLGLINGEEAPVLGPVLDRLNGILPPKAEDQARSVLRSLGGGIDRAEACLSRWPALFALLLTRAVASEYNPENGYSVHPALAKYLGVPQLSQSQRERLWSAYRSACRRVGLEVNPEHGEPQRIVGEFLHQVGLPVAFVERTAEVMIWVGKEIGLPDEDDPEALGRWQERLLERAKFAHIPPNARRALENDTTAYYPRLFCRACRDEDKAGGGEMLELMARTVRAQGGPHAGRHGLRIPKVVFRDGGLAVALPPGDGERWAVRAYCEGGPSEFACRGDSSELLVSLPETSGLMRRVEIRGERGEPFTTRLWEDAADNRLLIFGSSGALLRAAHLGGSDVEIGPGQYQCLLRFEPSNASAEQVGADPALFVLGFQLGPGEALSLTRGPAHLNIAAPARPAILWNGETVSTADGGLVHLVEGLGLTASGLGDADEVERGIQYFVRVRDAGTQIAEVPVCGGAPVPIPSAGSLSPGLHRLVAELFAGGARHPLARSAALVWPGLDCRDAAGRLCCRVWPTNLVPEAGRAAPLDPAKRRIGPAEGSERHFEVAFDIGGRLVTTKWEAPGLFAETLDYGADPVERLPVAVGSALSVDPTSRRVLCVTSTEAAELRLPDQRLLRIPKGRTLRLPVANVLESAAEGHAEIIIEAPGPARKLVAIRSLRAARELRYECAAGRRRFDLRLPAPCTRLRLTARDLVTGDQLAGTVDCDNPADLSDLAPLRLESATPGPGWTRLSILTAGWPEGLWLADPELEMAGRWAGLADSRGDPVAFGFEHPAGAAAGSTLSAETFLRAHSALQHVYASDCRAGLGWLVGLWRGHLRHASLADRGTVRRLAQLCGVEPPPTAPKTWLPPYRIEAHRPEILALPAEDYEGLDSSHGVIPWALGGLSGCDPDGGALHQTALFWLSDPGAPGIDAFRRILSALPEPMLGRSSHCEADQRLGPTHYWHARRELSRRFRETSPKNDMRRSRAYSTCQRLFPAPQRPGLALQEQPRPGLEYLEGDCAATLGLFESLIADFARACRREPRAAGSLQAFCERCDEAAAVMADPGEPEDLRIYLLQIGADLLAYYLILWEAVERATTKARGAHA